MKTRSCEACGGTIHLDTDAHAQYTTGWRRKGSSTLLGRQDHDRFIHKACLEAQLHTGSEWQQPSLFEDANDG